MSNLDIFRDEYLPNAQGATISFAGWKKNYPAEYAAWVAYRDQVLAGNLPQPPTMVSKYGKALAAAGHMAERDDMKVTVSTSGGTTNLTGTVTVTASPTPASQVTSVKFYVNSVLKSTDTSSPYTYAWDTTLVTPGAYELKAEALYPRNKKATGKLNVTVLNQGQPPPPPPPPIQDPPVNVTAPAVSGTATEGQALTVSTGVWTNDPTSYSRQWIRCDAAGANCVPIPSATGTTYVLTGTDVGATIRCAVTAYNSFGASPGIQTAQTAVVAALTPAVPVNVSLPIVSGTPTQGQSLGVSNGSWTNAPTSYTYQWRRCDSAGAACANISGATTASYLLTATDLGKTIRCNVVAVNASGSSTAAPSAASAVVIAPPPPPPAALGVDRATMLATGGTILREDPCTQVNPLPGLWGFLHAGNYPTIEPGRHVHKTTGGSTHLRANGTAQGNTHYRELTVVAGDDYYGPRCELGANTRSHENTGTQTDGTFALFNEGDHKIIFVSYRGGTGFTFAGTPWQIILQTKPAPPWTGHGPTGSQGAPAFEVVADEGKIGFHCFWANKWETTPPALGVWFRVALDVVFSKNPSIGRIQMFVDNDGDGDFLDADEASPVMYMQTLANCTVAGGGLNVGDSITSHLRVGLYQDAAHGTNTLHVDNVQIVG